MKKMYSFLAIAIFFFLFSVPAMAQVLQGEILGSSNAKRCATAEVLEQFMRSHPGSETTAQFESWIAAKIQERKAQSAGHRIAPMVTLPVVFHIIHNAEAVGSGRNITAAAIRQQVLQLNKDFANLSGSPYAVSEDMGIQFALAQNDPTGVPLAEPGIDRINRNTKGWTAPPYDVGYQGSPDYLNNTIKPNSIWDPTRYLNIWVSEWQSGILGIATFPGSSGLSGLNNNETDLTAGVSVGYQTVGSAFAPQACNNAVGKGRTLTHELGHFFGLRHIWGDATCGDDFCGDTPTHQQSNAGEPTHPKSNSCGTTDEMFENYMDYTDDIVTNTFTVNQGDRMEAVFANSPRRASLATSNAGLVPVTATNRIAFADCDGARLVSEAGLTGTYPRYHDINIPLVIEDKATAAATLTVTAGGTAVSGFHYQILSSPLNFATGDQGKDISIRIFDNAEVDGNKTIVLSYSISGTGITAGTSAQTMTITIVDNDALVAGEGTVTLLTENFNSGVLAAGWNSYVFGGGANTNRFTISTNGTAGGTGAAAHITNDQTAKPYVYTKTDASVAGIATSLIDLANTNSPSLSFRIRVWGQTNLDYARLYYATEAAPGSFSTLNNSVYYGTSSAVQGISTVALTNSAFANGRIRIGFLWQNDNSAGNDPPMAIDDITITVQGTRVETAVSNSYGYDLRSTATNHFRNSANGNIIASVVGLNANVSGVTASVTQSGTALVPLTTTVGSYSRSGKVVRLTPSVANTTATYQGTLYFTTAELAAWGADVPNLKILKAKDGVNLAGTVLGTDAQIVTATVDDQRATNGYAAFTGNFTGGFSQFMLVSPNAVLPVNLLDFEAKAQKTTILLKWATSEETNNRGFAIERSLNGADFEQIDWVNGAGTASRRTEYSYTDRFVQPGIVYYYRLRQTDFDNRTRLSDTRQAKIDNSGIVVKLTPNPASDNVSLFIAGISGKADINLINGQGQVVKQWKGVNATNTRTELNISGLAAGTYLLDITAGDKKLAEKLVIGQ